MNTQWRGKEMANLRMLEKLESGEAIDVRQIGVEKAHGLFKLDAFIDNVDYCDPQNEAWIWSIGKNIETGEIMASTGTEFYGNPLFECLFLR